MTQIREAFVLAPAREAMRSIAGVPLIVRTLVALERAGVERCTIVGPLSPPVDPRLRRPPARVDALAPLLDAELRVVVGAGAVIDVKLVRALRAAACPGEVVEMATEGAWVRVAPGTRIAESGGGRVVPVAGTLLSADTPAIEARLLAGLGGHGDGYLDHAFYRRLSRPLTRHLARTTIGPNAVTLIAIGIGVLGGLLLTVAGSLALGAAVLCLFVSGVLDCCDGELARLRLAETRLGHLLDIGGDTVVNLALLAGIAVRIARAGATPSGWALGALLAGVLAAFAAITWSEESATRRRGVDAWENRILDRVLSPLSTRDWYVFPLGLAALGALAWLVPAAAAGAHLFSIVTAVLVWRVLRRAAAVGQDQGSAARVAQ